MPHPPSSSKSHLFKSIIEDGIEEDDEVNKEKCRNATHFKPDLKKFTTVETITAFSQCWASIKAIEVNVYTNAEIAFG